MMKVRKRMSKWSGGGCREGRRVKVRGKNEEGYFRNIKSKSRGVKRKIHKGGFSLLSFCIDSPID